MPTPEAHVPQGIERDLILGDRYRLLERLKNKNPASTWKGLDTQTGGFVAIKLLVADTRPVDPERLRSLLPAILVSPCPFLARSLDLVAVKVGFEYCLFQISDFVQGRSLARIVQEDGPFDRARIQPLLEQLIALLTELKSQDPPLVHGDINPWNVIREDSGRLVLVDFVAPKAAARGQHTEQLGVSVWPRCVDHAFAAPEVLLGKPNPRSDLYSVGAVVLFCATGRAPQELLRSSTEALEASLRKVGCPARVVAVLEKCLELHAALRFSGPEEAREALSANLPLYPTRKNDEDTADWQAEPLPEKQSTWAGLGTLACALFASPLLLASLLAFVLRPAGEEPLVGLLRVTLGVLGILFAIRHFWVNLGRFTRPASYRLSGLTTELRVTSVQGIRHATWRAMGQVSRLGPLGVVDAWWTSAGAVLGERRRLILFPVYRAPLPEILGRIGQQGDRWRAAMPRGVSSPVSLRSWPGPIGVIVIGLLLLAGALQLGVRFDLPPDEPRATKGENVPSEIVLPSNATDEEMALAVADLLVPKPGTTGRPPANQLVERWHEAMEARLKEQPKETLFLSNPKPTPSARAPVEPAGLSCPHGTQERVLTELPEVLRACFDEHGTMMRVRDPEGRVSLLMDWTEVPVGEYARCLAEGQCTAGGDSEGCNGGVLGRELHPMNCVNRAQAAMYCEWAGRRLCGPGEWESAVGAGSFPWGEDSPDCTRAVLYGSAPDGTVGPGCGRARTAPVGTRPRGTSPSGILDLLGNVAEWTSDPGGLVCGGGFDAGKEETLRRPASRQVFPDAREPTIGFRCCRDNDPPGAPANTHAEGAPAQ